MKKAVDTVQECIANYAADFGFEKLQSAAVHAAKIRVIDTLGALVAGFFGEPCRISRKLAQSMSDANGATVIGTHMKTHLDIAAFVNGITAREAEMMDVYHWPGSFQGHPSDALMPIFSTAEYCHSTGRALLQSVVLAYEIFCRIADVFENRAFDHTNFACLAAAVGSGKLFNLTREQLRHCVSMAVVPNNILNQARSGQLSMYKVTATGQAGRAGIFAAMLARAGMQGPHLPFVGEAGWCGHVADSHFELTCLGGEHVPFKILDTHLKRRAAAAPAIASALAAEMIKPTNILDISRVTVEVHQWAKERGGTGELRWNPQTREMADHSIPYIVAATLVHGPITPNSYDDAHLWDPQLRTMMQKIEVLERREFTDAFNRVPVEHRARVIIHLQNGGELVGEANEGRLNDAEVTAKFRQLTEQFLGSKRTSAVLDYLLHLEDIDDMSSIPPMFSTRIVRRDRLP